MLAKLSRNTLIVLVSNVGSAGLSFLLSVLIARALGDDGFGAYATVLAWVFPLAMLVEYGLGTLTTRDVARDTTQGGDYLLLLTAARLVFGSVGMLLVIVAAPLLSDDPVVVLGVRLSAPMVMILPFFSALTAIFRAHNVMYPLPWLNIGMLLAQVMLTALVFALGGGVIAALIVNVLTSAGQLVAAWLVYRWRFFTPATLTGWGAIWGRTVALLRLATPFAFAGFFAVLQPRISVILLENLTDAATVGGFAAANRFIEAGRLIPNALFAALLPALSTLAHDSSLLTRTFRRVSAGLLAFGLLSAVIGSVLAAPIITLTYGAAFSAAVPLLQVLLWSLAFNLLRGGRTLYWYALGREGFVNRVNGVILVLQIALSLWLIPQYGALGVASALVIVEAVAALWLWVGRGGKPYDGFKT